jgi:hypothetical protein
MAAEERDSVYPIRPLMTAFLASLPHAGARGKPFRE